MVHRQNIMGQAGHREPSQPAPRFRTDELTTRVSYQPCSYLDIHHLEDKEVP